MGILTAFRSGVLGNHDILDMYGFILAVGPAGTPTSFTVSLGSESWTVTGTGFGGYDLGWSTTGTINSITFAIGGQTVCTLTNLSVSANTLFNLLLNLNLEAANRLVFENADTIIGSAEADILYGFGGNDNMTGGDGNDTLHGDNPNQSGVGGNDVIDGGAGNDIITGGAGANTLTGGAGDDTINSNAPGDTLDGGDGVDFLYMFRPEGGVNYTISNWGSSSPVTIADGTTFQNFERFEFVTVLGPVSLTFAGAQLSFDLRFMGGFGNDRLVFDFSSGSAGILMSSNYLSATSHTIELFNVETVQVTGGAGHDQLKADGGDIISGSDGNDLLETFGGTNTLSGGAGDDEFILWAHWNHGGVIDGGNGSDTLRLLDLSSWDLKGVTITTGAFATETGATFGTTTIRNIEVFNTIILTSGNDTFIMSPAVTATATSIVFGGDGVDTFIMDYSSLTTNFTGAAMIGQGFEHFVLMTGSGDDILLGLIGNDTLSAGAGNDSLNGGDGVDQLSGGGGNDILNGNAGADQMDGGDGDDTIYWDAADSLANVLGGAGSDLLVFSTASAPITFDLAAQGFERAEQRLTDTGGNAWATQTTFYDSAWRADFNFVLNDNGSYSEFDWDQLDAFDWATNWAQYDALSRADLTTTTFDSGVSAAYDFDQAGSEIWVSNWNQYAAGGALDINVTVFDSGIITSNDFDPENLFNWTSNWIQNDSGGALDLNVTVFDSGVTSAYDFDQTNAFNWVSNWNQYAAGGALDINVTVFDDGTSTANDFDEASAFDWISNWSRYDSGGNIDLNIVEFDNGNTAVLDYDQANAFTWATIWQLYDPNGVLIGYQGVNDDGSLFGGP